MDKEYKLGKFVGLNLSITGRVYPGIVSNGLDARESAQWQAAVGRLQSAAPGLRDPGGDLGQPQARLARGVDQTIALAHTQT